MSGNRARAGALLAVLGFLACATAFAAGQSIWVDETTQLRGLTLPFGEQLLWLTGRTDPGLGVPPDRMPPLSYWLGGIWTWVFGLSETTMRAMGIAAMAAAAPALFLAGQRIAGAAGGLFLVAAPLSAPGLIIMAGEIRTYPVFFCLSAWALWAYTGTIFGAPAARARHTVMLTLFAVLMSYAHFFGVVAGCCLFGGLFLHRLVLRQPLVPVIAAFAVVAVSWIGLAPFVMAAMGISDTDGPETAIRASWVLTGLLRFVVRLFADPVFLAARPALWLTGAAVALLAALACARALRPAEPRAATLALAFPVVSAVAGLGVLSVVISGFDPLSPSYNIWLVPFLFGFLAHALPRAGGRSATGRIAAAAGVALVAGNLLASGTLMRNMPLYTHGAGEWIAARIDDPGNTLVVHVEGDAWGHSYFPVFHLEGGGLTQVVRVPEAGYFRFSDMTVIPVADFEALRAAFDEVYTVRTVALSGEERAAIAGGEISCGDMLARRLGAAENAESYCGMFAARLSRAPR